MNRKRIHTILLLLFGTVFLLGLYLLKTASPVLGGDEACTNPSYPDCSPIRVINQWSCAECASYGDRCTNAPDPLAAPCVDDSDCNIYGGFCEPICIDTSYVGKCEVINETVPCNVSFGLCSWTGELDNCVWSGGECSEPGTTKTLSCCVSGGGSPDPTPIPTPTPSPLSCSISLPDVSLAVNSSTEIFITIIEENNGTIGRVDFVSGNTGIATVTTPDLATPFSTTITGAGVGSTTITATATMDDGITTCITVPPADSDVTITSPGPWWQVQDADIITNGNLFSLIPATTCLLPGCDPAFGLEGPGGYPGVPSYGGSYDFEKGGGTGTVSSTGWLAKSMTTLNKVYDYSYFEGLVRPDVEINEIIEPEIQGGFLINQGNATRGYVWFKRQGDLTITGTANLQDRKVVLLIDGDLYLGRPPAQSGSKIQVRDGSGFFMAIVSGDIIISPKAEIDPLNPQPVFEGIFLAEGQVKTGTEGPELDEQLWIRGSVAAYGGVVLERDLTDNSVTPAEFFEYGPDLLFTFPRDLTSRRYKWKEIAP